MAFVFLGMVLLSVTGTVYAIRYIRKTQRMSDESNRLLLCGVCRRRHVR
ncbi:hypothetical protein IFE09_11280 [Streptomyces microflavus]|nr:hypothetical protein [Streptomyces microflavus]QQZ54139.1 hypothetical protein IFE09_11280 [Streptomyces microflavus]